MILRIAICCLLIFVYTALPANGQTVKGKSIQTHTIKLSSKDAKGSGQTGLRIAFLAEMPYESADTVIRSAFIFLKSSRGLACDYITAGDLAKHPSAVRKYNCIFYLKDVKGEIPPPLAEAKTVNAFREFIVNGGSLLVSGFALHYLNNLGVESQAPSDSIKPCIDDGNGRKLGFHAYTDHPVFDGMNGGAYILRPFKDQDVGICGYFGNKLPGQGKVVAVDWDYIFLREESKLVMEYEYGRGKVLAVGGYMDFSQPNINRLHLEKFTLNCLQYLTDNQHFDNRHYWDYSPNKVLHCSPDSIASAVIPLVPATTWEEPADDLAMERRYSSNEFWDVAGERLLTLGTENGGIEEVWAHPFMAFRDYEVGIKFDYKDTIYWLNDQRPEVQKHPAYFCRLYKFPRAYLKEIAVNDPEDPAGVIHYEYIGVYGAEIFIRFKSSFRWMWPYSEKATGSICHNWVEDANALKISDQRGKLSLLVGSGQTVVQQLSGQFSGFEIGKNYKAWGIPTEDFQAAGFLHYRLEMSSQLDVVYAAGNEGEKITRECYVKYASKPEAIFRHAIKHTNDLLHNRLMITSPDADFDKGYRLAVISTDQFFVNTPGLGKSLVAGYATTKHGWDGAQKVSGRPGYAWYFGRDGQWSGLALLGEGDYEKVKSELEFYQKYQDLNGKILHEASTSGIVHYDASDATPLYLILAGRYFRYSNDTAFLRKSWPQIQKAIDFCFSTDTDRDHLIENTNVGHGWVEGGELYGSHVTFYMTGCWGEVLKEASNMARFMNEKNVEKYSAESELIRKIINTDFWNPGTSFFNYGKNLDGTYRSDPTVLPAVPLCFGFADPEKAALVLRQYASNAFTTNWGVRIIRDDSRLFKPTGYHYGSVWPLFTGWTSLAEYKYGNTVQGYAHLMNNLNVFKTWALGNVQEVLNGAVYKPSGVCANQCWSETMVVQPAIDGMLGLDADAGNGRLRLCPALPAHWDSLEVRNIRTGNRLIHMQFKRTPATLSYNFNGGSNDGLIIEFAPLLPAGTRVLSCRLNHKEVPFTSRISAAGTMVRLEFPASPADLVEFDYQNGISVLPVVQDPKPGYASAGLRILDAGLEGKLYTVLTENEAGSTGLVRLWSNRISLDHIENGKLLESKDNLMTIQLVFPDEGKKYTELALKIFLK